MTGIAVCCAASPAGAAPGARSTAGDESTVPLPPPRPADLGGKRRDVLTRGLQAPPPPAPEPAVVVATVPRALPQATRVRMHECGLEWQQIKWTGAAGERTWRDFAMECLPR